MHRGAVADLCAGRSDTFPVPQGVPSANLDAAAFVVPHADALTRAYIHTGRGADSHRDATPWGQCHLYLHGDAYDDVHTLCYPHRYQDSDTDAHLHPYSDPLTYTDPYGDMDAESDAQLHAEPDRRRLANTAAPAERSVMLAKGNVKGKRVPSSCCRRDT